MSLESKLISGSVLTGAVLTTAAAVSTGLGGLYVVAGLAYSLAAYYYKASKKLEN